VSATRPSSQPPSGRKKNASAYVAAVLRFAATSLPGGKKFGEMKTRNVAKIVQPYHSMAFPVLAETSVLYGSLCGVSASALDARGPGDCGGLVSGSS